MENFPKTIDKMLDLWYTIIVPRENTINKREVFSMFEKFQVNGYDKENDVAIQLTTSNIAIALSQYETIKENCDNGNIIDANTGEVYAHFSYTADHCGVDKHEWASNQFIEALEELTEYGCP